MSLQAVAGLIGAFALTGGLLLLTVRLLRHLQGGFRRSQRLPFEVVQRHALGPKQGLVVVRLGGRVLVLATADQGSRLVTELRGEDRAAILEAPAADRPVVRSRKDPDFKKLLARLTLVALLGLGLSGPVQGQTRPRAAAGPARADTGKALQVSPPTSVAPKPERRAPAQAIQGPRVSAPTPPNIEVKIGQGSESLHLSGTVGLVVFLGALTLLPAVVLLMTSFTRILVVLHFLRSALGTQGSPPGQLMVAIAVLLTGVVMQPVIAEVNQTAVQPYFDGQIQQAEAYTRALQPLRRFMLANVRERDLATFAEMGGVADADSFDDLPTLTIVSAFVTSELQSAFWMGFVIFLPFVVVDLIVATSLMSLGMFMVPPVMISLPFKLLLFVLADGWSLVAQNLVASFHR
jgi:flagellar biosynthesis protein FliP